MSASFTVQGVAVKIRIHGKNRPQVVEKQNGRLEGVVPKDMPYPVAVAALKPMVEELLQKRAQARASDNKKGDGIVKGKHLKRKAPTSIDQNSDDYFPQKGELELVVNELPIHVTFGTKKHRYFHMSPSGRVEAFVTGGSERKEVTDFFCDNIEKIRRSIDELNKNTEASDAVIYYESSRINDLDATGHRTHGLMVYVTYTNEFEPVIHTSFSGDLLLSIYKVHRISDVIKFLEANTHILQKYIDETFPDKDARPIESEPIKPCILAYKDFLAEIIPTERVGIELSLRPDGVAMIKVPLTITLQGVRVYLEQQEDAIREVLSDSFFLKPDEEKLLESIETLDTLTRNTKADQNLVALKKSAFEKARNYLGKGEYTMNVDDFDVRVVVKNLKDGQLRAIQPGIPEVSIPPTASRGFVREFVRDKIAWLRKKIVDVKSRPPIELLEPGRTTYENYTIDVELDERRHDSSTIKLMPDGTIKFKTFSGTPKSIFLEKMAKFVDKLQRDRADRDAGISEDKVGKVYYNGMVFWLWGEKYVIDIIVDDIRAEAQDIKVITDLGTIEIPVRAGQLDRIESDVARWCEQSIAIKCRQFLELCEKVPGFAPISLCVKMLKSQWSSNSKRKRSITLSTDLIHRDPRCLALLIMRELLSLFDPSAKVDYKELLNEHVPDWPDVFESLKHPFPPLSIDE
ncbi:MAG: M48 family metallopeptidase [Desulfovibrio sp.]|jgi:predicted metal-dependent hydrolase|nr:M48 family metallopeptidase [Desulfovibrio sp.]